MNKIFTLLLSVVCLNLYGQKDPMEASQAILAEGEKLYRSEMASWYGTDLFLEQFENKEDIGGYFSYTEEEVSKCIFFSRYDPPKVMGTISFDATYDLKAANVDLKVREFTDLEQDLFLMRRNAMAVIQSDTLFKMYQRTNLNLIPLVEPGNKRLYVLTGPEDHGVVIFGNDYLLTFNDDNEVTGRKRLHQNLIPVPYTEPSETGEDATTVHTHLPATGDLITATDVCTLMLYGKFSNWTTHNIVSKQYLSIWSCETNTIMIMSMKEVKKIGKDQEKREKKRKKGK